MKTGMSRTRRKVKKLASVIGVGIAVFRGFYLNPVSRTMQVFVDELGELPADARHALQVLDACLANLLLAAEMQQQFLAFARPHPRNRFKLRTRTGLAPALPVRRYRKT